MLSVDMQSCFDVTRLFGGTLPGKTAQCAMAPPSRLEDLYAPDPPDARQAAVAIILRPTSFSACTLSGWSVLLIRRNSYPGVHSGQIALPGGKRDPGDASLWDTARRETAEEVGIHETQLDYLGKLTSIYVPPSHFVIHPFAAVCREAVAVCPDPREVVDYKYVPLNVLDPRAARTRRFPYPDGSTRPAPAWEYEDFVIWGATAMILAELFALVQSASDHA